MDSLELSSLATSHELLSFNALITGLETNTPYFVVLNNSATDIVSPANTYRKGLVGRVDDDQSEGTFGAAAAFGMVAKDTWIPINELVPCHPSGACPNYFQMQVTSASLLGDFDASGELDVGDIDLLSEQVLVTPDDRSFDLNNDAVLTNADREIWVHELAGTLFGDADLNGEVAFADFLQLADHFGQQGGWGQGDFDGDGQIEFPDFLTLSANFSGESNAAASAVPEPTSIWLAMFGILGLIGFRRRR